MFDHQDFFKFISSRADYLYPVLQRLKLWKDGGRQSGSRDSKQKPRLCHAIDIYVDRVNDRVNEFQGSNSEYQQRI